MRKTLVVLAALAALVSSGGCGSSGPEPGIASPPPSTSASDRAPANSNSVTTASDSVGSVPGSTDALFVYRFRQIEPSSGGAFSFRDRELSFSFRPSPNRPWR